MRGAAFPISIEHYDSIHSEYLPQTYRLESWWQKVNNSTKQKQHQGLCQLSTSLNLMSEYDTQLLIQYLIYLTDHYALDKKHTNVMFLYKATRA
jgi:hypothetical protein